MAITNTFAQLTAAGNSAAVNVSGYKNHVVAFTIASIDSNVDYRVEGSLDGSNYFNLGSGDTKVTANGTYRLSYENMPLQTLRVVFAAEAGGTAVTIDAVSMHSI